MVPIVISLYYKTRNFTHIKQGDEVYLLLQNNNNNDKTTNNEESLVENSRREKQL